MTLQERMKGKLPEIDIAGTMFYVDIRMDCLRADYRLLSEIKFDKMETGPGGKDYRFAFDMATKKMVIVDPAIKEWPANTLIVQIPNEIQLDPYGWSRSQGLDPVEYCKQHPIEKELKAKIIPLDKTGFPAMIKKNNQNQEPQLKKKDRSITKRQNKRI